MQIEADHTGSRGLSLPMGIGLLSMGGLLLEVALTRLFSTLFYPPAVFAVLSLAILGLGLGAALATGARGIRREARLPLYLALAGFSALLIALLASLARTQAGLYPAAVLPFFFIGVSLTTLFSSAPAESPQRYLADLVGAGAGALLAVPALNALGGLNAVLLAGVILGLSGLLLPRPAASWAPLAAAGMLALALTSNVFIPWLEVPIQALGSGKPLQESLASPGSAILRSEWDAFARTDLVDPGDGSPYRVYMDGAAGSLMPSDDNAEFLWRDIGFFPFATQQPERVFIIGPGGGLDVWFGLQSGAREIVAVEVNPASVRLVREYAPYNGDLYGQANVQVLVDEGRSVLRRQARRYDLIFLSQVVTLAAERSGYALVENSSYTVEAFQEYLAHLAPEGQIAIKLYDESTLTRALSTALAAFRAQGLSDQEGLQHVAALLDASAQPPIPLLVIGKRAFSEEDARSMGSVAQGIGFTPLYLPGALANPPLDEVAAGAKTFSQVIAPMQADLSPTRDNRPFFYQFERGLPKSLQPPLWGSGVVVLLGGVALAWGQRGRNLGPWRWAPLYFAGLGLGFMMVEVVLIQQTRLFLGHPTPATTTVLATLLIGGGAGSGLAGRVKRAGGLPLPAGAAGGVALLLVAWSLLWPRLSEAFTAAAPPVRTLAAAAALLPLGLLMGMPFPLGLRAAGALGDGQVAGAWAVNGVMTVVGSVLAMALAIQWGFSSVLIAGGLAYALSAGMALWLGMR
jgi:hypothetical protein